MAEREGAVAEREDAVAEREDAVDQREDAVAEREDAVDEGSTRAVAVGLAAGDPRGERIAAIAGRLDVPIVEGVPQRGRTSIGSVLLPSETDDWYLEAAILRALEPRHILFLCVANSARSQLAEGIARSMIGERVTGSASPGSEWPDSGERGPGGEGRRGRGGERRRRPNISSAGSEPTSVRPQAVAVLDEIGIDISGQRSMGIDEVEGPVDAVVTLCAEEVCPVWLEDAWRVHWSLPDPAAVEGSDEEKLEAFRAVRDELRRRLGVLFHRRPV